MADPYMLPPATVAPAEPPRSAARVVLGLVLALPAFVLLLTSYVEPLVWTVRSSLTNASLLDAGGESVGLDNYGAMADAGLGAAFGRSLLLAIVPLLIVLVLAPVLAWLAHSGGTAGRWAARGLLALPLAAFAPTAAAAGPMAAAAEDHSGPPSALVVYWLTSFGLAAALSVTLYLAALRRRSRPALLVAGGLGALTVVALAVQSFTVPAVVGGTRPGENVPSTLMYQEAFVRARIGTGAAVSSVLLIVLLVLGAAATLLLILSRTRLEFDDERPPGGAFPAGQSQMYVFAAIAGGVALIVLVVSLLGLGGWLTRSTESFESGGQEGNVGVNTWLPGLLSAVIGVTVATLAAVGISGLRPLGRHSEWLLAPFGLFLFVGITPLALRAFESTRGADRLGTFIGLMPPGGSVAIPALFVLALLVRGQLERRAAAAARGEPVAWARTILGAAPMLLLAYLVTWIVSAQDLIWGVLASGDHFDAQVLMLQALGARSFGGRALPFSQILPLWALILLFLVALAAQVVYLDRIALRAGRRAD